MLRHVAAVLATAAVLLGSSARVTFAHDGVPSTTQQPANAVSAVIDYFAALDSGWRTGGFSRLRDVVAPDASIVRTDARGHTTVYGNLAAIESYFRNTREQRGLPEVGITGITRLSASVVIAYTEASRPGNRIVTRSAQVFVVRDGTIVGCSWTVIFDAER